MLGISQISNRWLAIIGLVTLPLVGFAVAYEFWYAFLLPPALLLVWVSLYRLDWAMWFIVFATPISINLTDLTGGAGLSLPTEPMLVLVVFIALIKMTLLGEFERKIIRHPISIAIYIYLAWMLFTAITSQLPLVSLKQLATRIWFIVPYYFVLAHLFLKSDRNKLTFLWLFPVSYTHLTLPTKA